MAILEEPIREVKQLKNYINGEWVESKGEPRISSGKARSCWVWRIGV